MSHLHERKEKTCLNCGTPLVGRYCHDCGQQNLEPKESFAHILRHFTEDVTHFDGKFFSTIKLLLTKPGFLTAEYMKGRRAAYLNPIRMYLFVSAVFFIVILSLFDKGLERDLHEKPSQEIAAPTKKDPNTAIVEISTVREYDSLQAITPLDKRDSKIESFVTRRVVGFIEYINSDREHVLNIIKSIMHTLPKIMFVTMPVMALIFYAVYYKERQTYYYVAHGIFTLHLFTAQFLIMLVALPAAFIPKVGMYLFISTFATVPIYQYIAMLRFYKQSAFSTFIKYNYIAVLYSILNVVLLALYITGYTLTSSNTHH